jgi:5-methylcytosine-specific restriction protein A
MPACIECGITIPSTERRCETHEAARRAELNARLGTRQQRGYGPEYQRVRRVVLAEELVCSRCGEPGTEGDPLEVHHIVDVADGGGHERENLTARHHGCHPPHEGQRRPRRFMFA